MPGQPADYPSVRGDALGVTASLPARWRRIGAMALLLLGVLLVYGQTCRFELLTWDDEQHLTFNPRMQTVTWSTVGNFWREPYWGMYIPVSYTLLSAQAAAAHSMVQYPAIFGHDPWQPWLFHLVNLVLHACCVVLVWSLLVRLVRNPAGAAAGALLFAWHPLQAESVAWISEQRGLLATMFCLLALRFYIRFSDLRAADRPSPSGRPWVAYAAATAALMAALLSKPSAAALPLVAGVIEVVLLRRPLRRAAAALAPWLLLVIASALISKLQQPDTKIEFITPLWLRPLVAFDAVTFYVYKLVLPLRLTMGYGRAPQLAWQAGWLYWTWIPSVVLLGLFCWLRPLRPWTAPAAVFLAALLPVLGFIPFGFQSHSTVADRYTYLAMLGPALAVAMAWGRWPTATFRWICTAGLLLLAGLCWQQVAVWRTSITMYEHALRVNPSSALAHNNLGMVLLREQKWTEALPHFQRAIESKPNNDSAYNNLGITYRYLGQPQAERAAYLKSLEYDPASSVTELNLGLLEFREHHPVEARRHFERALSLDPQSATACNYLGILAAKRKDVNQARAYFERCLKITDNNADAHCNLGAVLFEQQDYRGADRHYARAIELDPGSSEAHQNVGRLRLLQNDPAAAARSFEIAVRLTPASAEAHFGLASAYVQLGDTARARPELVEGLRLDPSRDDARKVLESLP